MFGGPWWQRLAKQQQREEIDRAEWIEQLADRWQLVRRGHRAGIYLRCAVTLACGHDFIEHRPPIVLWPVQGELRVCGSFEHYPAVYPATYTDIEQEQPHWAATEPEPIKPRLWRCPVCGTLLRYSHVDGCSQGRDP